MTVVHADPTKRFFIEMITRDLSLEDSILDLVDNSIDSFVRTRGVDLSVENLMGSDAFINGPRGEAVLGHIALHVSEAEFRIEDRTGGIPLDLAINEVFRFGSTRDRHTPSLGVYGIGLKRAMFKIGTEITITSQTVEGGFTLVLPVKEWEADDRNWDIPIEVIGKVDSLEQAGTTISIRGLYPNVQARIADGTFETTLHRVIGRTYPFFLNRLVSVQLNGVPVPPVPIPLGRSEVFTPAHDRLTYDDVNVSLLAGLADREKEWNIDRAGWYIVCNGRVVVSADKAELTGWGVNSPQFVSKFRGFVGVALFFSENPASLPWTTTKRGINQESPAYLLARKQMQITAKPVLSFLSSMYPTDAAPDSLRRQMTENVRQADLASVAKQSPAPFRVVTPERIAEKTTTKVQYDAENADLDRVRRCLKKRQMSATKIGEYTLKYFLDMECPE